MVQESKIDNRGTFFISFNGVGGENLICYERVKNFFANSLLFCSGLKIDDRMNNKILEYLPRFCENGSTSISLCFWQLSSFASFNNNKTNLKKKI